MADTERIEFDPDVQTDDGESLHDSTTSITSSLLEYRTLHGRTYQSSQTTEYWAPNDQQHIQAFDVAHQWLTMMLGDKLFAAPIGDNPERILDVGTGTGIWAIDMADAFPSARVIGTDITPTQPSWVPPNVSFQIEDAQQDWTFPEAHFDFVHVRYLHGAVADWDRFYAQMFRALKPGGWFQHVEPNIELRCGNPAVEFGEDHVFRQWSRLFYDAGDKIGRSFRIGEDIMTGWAASAGFSGIQHTQFTLPHGAWPRDPRLKEMGAYTRLYMNMSLDGFALFPVGQILGWTLDEVHDLVARMRATINNPSNRTNSDMHMVIGQKPKA